MKSFNLLISTSRFNEINAKAELWFTLLLCGDDYPIISSLNFPGLVTGLTNLSAKEVIFKIKKILEKDLNFFQFISKIIPINFVCETNSQVINQLIQLHYKDYIYDTDSFRITLNRRKHEQIERNNSKYLLIPLILMNPLSQNKFQVLILELLKIMRELLRGYQKIRYNSL